ncbi:unnamed protein product [Allacma fusca]|uniref:Uncharacterized protein n=1 Tax=Allacma fusca TaxID=39272 RepID=A0A8J2KS79_9HEXA|nr:unnamed protein product [Allacma fusca]
MRSGVVTFAVFFCILLSSIATCHGAFIGASSGGGSKDDRNEIQGGYSLREPDLPALYSAPKSHQEQDAADNEVDQQSSTDRDSTTTEVYFEDREEDTSEDYPYTTLATQNPRDVPTSDYGAPTTPEKPYSSHDNTGGYGGYADSRRQNNNSKQLENPPNMKPLDQQQIENHQFPQHSYIPPPMVCYHKFTVINWQLIHPRSDDALYSHRTQNHHSQSQQQQHHPAITSQYGPPNPHPQPEHRVTEEIPSHPSQFNPQQKNRNDNNQYTRTNEVQNDYQQPQYLPPQSEPFNNRESHKQPEQPQSLNEPQRYVTAHDITSAAREYGTPFSYHSQSSPSLQSQEQGYFPQGEHGGQQNKNYETQPNPTGNHQQPQQPFQQQLQVQQNQLYQSPQQEQHQPQQQQHQPQQQQHQPQQQQHQPQQQQHQPQQQQHQPQQQQHQPQQQQYQPQQQQYQPQQQQYQPQQQQSQGQQQRPNQENIQQQQIHQQQPQFYSSPDPTQQPQEIATKPQPDQPYLPPANNFQQSSFPNEDKNQRAVDQPETRQNYGIPPANNIFEFDRFHDNDNVVDAELLQRVQYIIEEHERQQKEIQDKLRRENEANEAFFRTAQNQIESSQNDFNAGINSRDEGPYFSEDNSGLAPDNRLNEQGFYGRPSLANNNSAGMHNDVEKQRSLQIYPKPGFGEPEHLDKLGETKNYLNSPYGVPGIQFESDPFRQEQTFPGNHNLNLEVHPSSLSPTEDSRLQFHPKSQGKDQQQIHPDGVNGISNERQYESSVSYNGPQHQVQWSNPTLSNPLNTANAPLSNTDPIQSGQRSNENPSTIQASSSGKPHIEYQKAILTEHFVETKPEFPSRVREDSSRRGEYTISAFETPNNSPLNTPQGRVPFPSQLTSSSQGHEPNQFQSPNPSIYNRGTEQHNEKGVSAYAPGNELENQPREPNQYQNQHSENAQAQIGNSNFYNPNEQSQNREINSDGELLHFSNQYGLPYSQPTAFNYQENSRNNGERVQDPPAPPAAPKHDQPQYTNPQGPYPNSFTSHENSRTIVVHEVPFASVQGVSNRVVINPNEQSSPLSNQNEYKEQQQDSPDNSFRRNPSAENEINFLYNKNSVSFQQQTFQDSPPNLQYGLQQGSPQNQEGKSEYLPSPPDTSSNPGYMSGGLGSNEILSPSPKPVYGIPLAPVLDPESLTSIDHHDSSVVLSSQISFGDIGALSDPEAKRNPNDNINIVPYSPIVPSHPMQIHDSQQFQQLHPFQQQQEEHEPQQHRQVQQEQLQQQPQYHQSQQEHIQQQQHQIQQEIIQQQYQIQQEIQQHQPLQVPSHEFYAQPQLVFSDNSNEYNNNQIQLKPEILPQYTNLVRQGSWVSDAVSDVTAVPALYGLPQPGPSVVSEPAVVYGVSNHTSSPSSPPSIYSVNNDAPLTSNPLVSNSVSPSQNGYFYSRRNRSLKPKFSSPVRSPLVTSFTVKSNNKE